MSAIKEEFRKNLHENTVIFLGAGASKADSAPLQNELFKSYYKARESEGLMEYHQVIDEFFCSFFGIKIDDTVNTDKINFPTFEETLGVLDIAIDRKEDYKNTTKRLEEYREALVISMGKAISYKLDESVKDSYAEKGGHHIELARKIKLLNQKQISFISTNYDLLIDNALDNQAFPPRSFDYGIGSKVVYNSGNKLLKIHGALNWLYCPICNKLNITPGQKSMLDIVYDPNSPNAICKSCKKIRKPVIVPPTYFKDMRNIFLSKIWSVAYETLLNANHIIFCGYSLPDADIHIKYLLKRAEMNRGEGKKFHVTVINNHDKKSPLERSNERRRFQRFFSNKTNVKYTRKSFEEFAKDPLKYIV